MAHEHEGNMVNEFDFDDSDSLHEANKKLRLRLADADARENTSMGDFEFGIEPGAISILAPDEVRPGVIQTAQRMVQNRAMSLLKQDHSHARKIREYEDQAKADQVSIAKLEGALRLASKVLVDGDEAERKDVAGQINKILNEGQTA